LICTARHRQGGLLTLTAFILAAVLVGIAGGCGRSDMHRVSGRVHFVDGSPLRSGRVVVEYDGAQKGGAWGRIKENGSFTIGTLSENDGMKAGTYSVTIRDAFEPATRPDKSATPLVHPRFLSPATSGLSFEVPKQTKWDIVVEKP
jgi:hypothetical protein